MLYGIDTSSAQKGINLSMVAANFVIVKASEGTSSTYPTRPVQADAALAAGKLLGLYHFARPDLKNTAAQEAAAFVTAIKGYVGKAVLVLDWESGDLTNTTWVRAFLDAVHKATGVRPLIYMSASVISRADWSKIAKDTGLWLAGYPKTGTVTGFNPPAFSYKLGAWKTWTIWQYTSHGRLPGWSKNLDLDLFNGTKTDWAGLAKKATPSIPQIVVDGKAGPATVKRLQAVLGTTQDGLITGQPNSAKPYHDALYAVRYGPGSSSVVKAIQKRLGVTADGWLGPATIRQVQARYKVKKTSHFDAATVRAVQAALNKGAF